ncbi:hypothetical protein [Rhizobium yanglingense]
MPAWPEQLAKDPTALDRLRQECDAYLRQQRALSEATIYHCMRFLERFMAFRFGETLGDLNAITPDDIVAFLGQLKAGSAAIWIFVGSVPRAKLCTGVQVRDVSMEVYISANSLPETKSSTRRSKKKPQSRL